MDQIGSEVMLSALEATRLTDDEILHSCGLTMEDVILKHKQPSVLDVDQCLNRTSTQHSISFHDTLSLQEGNSYPSSVAAGMIQTIHSDMHESGEREFVPLDSITIEFSKHVLPCWAGELSVSLPTHHNRNRAEQEIVYTLCPNKHRHQGE
jgi:hypothetical protein